MPTTAEVVSHRTFCDRSNEACADLVATAKNSAPLVHSSLRFSTSIVDLISTENLLALKQHPFAGGSLCDYLWLPSGLALTAAVAMRLAITWQRHRLPRPTAVDLEANDRLRMIWGTMTSPALPNFPEHCVLDCVVGSSIYKAALSVPGDKAAKDEHWAHESQRA